MTEERLKEIKDSIDFQNNIAMIRDYDRLFIDEELELYNEVVRLREIIDDLINTKNEVLDYINNYCSMELRYRDEEVEEKLLLIKNILNKRLKQNNLTVEQLTGVAND